MNTASQFIRKPQDVKPGEWLAGNKPDATCAIRLIDASCPTASKLQSAPFDRMNYLVEGGLEATIGDQSFSVAQDTLVFIPAGTPYMAELDKQARVLEVYAPGGVNLDAQLIDTEARRVANASDLLRPLDASVLGHKKFSFHPLVERKSGSEHLRLTIFEVQPEAGGPDYHLHEFDQYYFILSGEMTLDLGLSRHKVAPGSFVTLPEGVVHRNFNAGSIPERHVNILVPEAEAGAIFDYAVEIHQRKAQIVEKVPE